MAAADLTRATPPAPLPPRIDAHQHFWQLARGDYRWLRADVPALAPIHRDFGPADLAPLAQAAGVQATVLVQAADTTAETDFMLTLAAQHPGIAAVVGWVDVSDAASVATLERWVAQGGGPGVSRLRSIRPMLQDLPQADWIATRPHPAVMEALQRLGLRFDALVQPWHLRALLAFAQAWPALPIVIDHAAKPQLARGWNDAGPAGDWVAQWRSGMRALAALPNVCCKLSGLLTEAAPPARAGGDAAVAALAPVWSLLLDAFGPQRLMWGSDWPVLNLAADHPRWVAVSEALIAPLSADEQDAIRRGTAARFYGIDLAGLPEVSA